MMIGFICSCTVKPFTVTRSTQKHQDNYPVVVQTQYKSLGWSIATKSDYENATYSDGTGTMTYTTSKKDETVVPSTYIIGKTIVKGMDIAVPAAESVATDLVGKIK